MAFGRRGGVFHTGGNFQKRTDHVGGGRCSEPDSARRKAADEKTVQFRMAVLYLAERAAGHDSSGVFSVADADPGIAKRTGKRGGLRQPDGTDTGAGIVSRRFFRFRGCRYDRRYGR